MQAGAAVVAAVLMVGCGSVAPPTAQFHALRPTQPTPITDKAITVRGVQRILAAHAVYLGVLEVADEGRDARVEVVREATRAAAEAGGTHILLRTAEVAQVEDTEMRTSEDDRTHQRRTVPYTTHQLAGVTAQFDVFRVEPAMWVTLQPELRPSRRSSP